MAQRWLDINLTATRRLKEKCLVSIDQLLSELPDLDWNSRLEVKDFFQKELGLPGFESLDIPHLQGEVIALAAANGRHYCEIVETYLEYRKLREKVRDYLDCMLRHAEPELGTEENPVGGPCPVFKATGMGRLRLREVNGAWLLPNKRPLPVEPELRELIVNEGEEQ